MTGKALQAWGLVVFIVLLIIFCYRRFGLARSTRSARFALGLTAAIE
jgi:hypothetical protein